MYLMFPARAAFEQKVYDKGGKLTQEAKGSFVFQRPGRFRWVYDKPADQVIVGDGERVWIYDRELNQVTVRKLTAALGSTPAALLSGSADVAKAFEMSDAGSRDGVEWLQAVPRDREPPAAVRDTIQHALEIFIARLLDRCGRPCKQGSIAGDDFIPIEHRRQLAQYRDGLLRHPGVVAIEW